MLGALIRMEVMGDDVVTNNGEAKSGAGDDRCMSVDDQGDAGGAGGALEDTVGGVGGAGGDNDAIGGNGDGGAGDEPNDAVNWSMNVGVLGMLWKMMGGVWRKLVRVLEVLWDVSGVGYVGVG